MIPRFYKDKLMKHLLICLVYSLFRSVGVGFFIDNNSERTKVIKYYYTNK